MIAAVTDSLLSQAKITERRHLKPGREGSTPTRVDVRLQIPADRVRLDQFSYTGLKAYVRNKGGDEDRKKLFDQFKETYVNPLQRPSVWYCIVGINDLQHVRYDEVVASPEIVLGKFVQFFDKLRRFSPGSTVVWLSVGNLRKGNKAFDVVNAFRTYLRDRRTVFPSWLVFNDITQDCVDKDIKDQCGHWTNGYVRRVVHRLLRCVTDEIRARPSAGKHTSIIEHDKNKYVHKYNVYLIN